MALVIAGASMAGIAACINNAPAPAAERPPKLHMPWNDDIYGRLNCLPTSLACAFMSTPIEI
jgi:hypothetical protein